MPSHAQLSAGRIFRCWSLPAGRVGRGRHRRRHRRTCALRASRRNPASTRPPGPDAVGRRFTVLATLSKWMGGVLIRYRGADGRNTVAEGQWSGRGISARFVPQGVQRYVSTEIASRPVATSSTSLAARSMSMSPSARDDAALCLHPVPSAAARHQRSAVIRDAYRAPSPPFSTTHSTSSPLLAYVVEFCTILSALCGPRHLAPTRKHGSPI